MRLLFCALLGAIVLSGAACKSAPKTQTDSTGVTYTKSIHDLYVWTAPGFSLSDLRGKNLSAAPATAEVAPPSKPEEAQQFDRLRRMLRDELIYALDAKKVFGLVRQSDDSSATPFVLETAIVDYYEGNPALRFTVGFGAGYPSITVRGTIRDSASGRAVFQFRTQREFEARPFEYTDSQILDNNIKDLATDLADYLARAITGQPLKN